MLHFYTKCKMADCMTDFENELNLSVGLLFGILQQQWHFLYIMAFALECICVSCRCNIHLHNKHASRYDHCRLLLERQNLLPRQQLGYAKLNVPSGWEWSLSALTLCDEEVEHGEHDGVATEHVVSAGVHARQRHPKAAPDGQRPA